MIHISYLYSYLIPLSCRWFWWYDY